MFGFSSALFFTNHRGATAIDGLSGQFIQDNFSQKENSERHLLFRLKTQRIVGA